MFGAGVVPDRPRLLVNLWKDNRTAVLAGEAGTLAITVLSAAQVHLVDVLGLKSGNDGPKLEGVAYELTATGDPYFPGGAALLECEIIERLDLGDAWAFLVAVRERRRLSDAAPLSRQELMSLAGADVRDRWAAKIAAAIPAYRIAMHWMD